ncbi:MAG: hypothetical protein K0Q50_373 [Vampirovibrio sp.]|jgi:hypothetical protein|nr:hypothetical protein [Vampirovibrio sp.]
MTLKSLKMETQNKSARTGLWFESFFSLFISCCLLLFSHPGQARTIATPWTPEISFQSLVYGASSSADVVRVMGQPPDEVLKAEQMFPVVENFYYYDSAKSGAATVFVFEGGLLVGLQLKTPGDQFVDLTYMLTNNNDRALNSPLLGGYMPYYPYYPLTHW